MNAPSDPRKIWDLVQVKCDYQSVNSDPVISHFTISSASIRGFDWTGRSQGHRLFRRDGERFVRSKVGAHEETRRFVESNNRRWRSRSYRGQRRISVVQVMHPSMADWRIPNTDVSPLVAGGRSRSDHHATRAGPSFADLHDIWIRNEYLAEIRAALSDLSGRIAL